MNNQNKPHCLVVTIFASEVLIARSFVGEALKY